MIKNVQIYVLRLLFKAQNIHKLTSHEVGLEVKNYVCCLDPKSCPSEAVWGCFSKWVWLHPSAQGPWKGSLTSGITDNTGVPGKGNVE